METSQRRWSALILSVATVLMSGVAYLAGHPDEDGLQRLFDEGIGAGMPFRFTEYVENRDGTQVSMMFESDARRDEERLRVREWIQDPDGTHSAGYSELHRKGVYMIASGSGKSSLARSYDHRSLNPWTNQTVVNASWSKAEVRTPGGDLLGTLTLDWSHRIARIDLPTQNRTDPSEVRYQLFEHGPVHFPPFTIPDARSPMSLYFEVKNVTGRLHTADLYTAHAVLPQELTFRFLSDDMGVVEEIGFEDILSGPRFQFRWWDWNGNGLVDTGDAVEYRFAPPATHVWVYDEWAQAYAENAPSGGVVLVLSLLIAAAAFRRRQSA